MIGDMRIKVQNVGRFFKNKYQKGVAFPGWRHTVSKTKKIKGSDGLVFIVFLFICLKLLFKDLTTRKSWLVVSNLNQVQSLNPEGLASYQTYNLFKMLFILTLVFGAPPHLQLSLSTLMLTRLVILTLVVQLPDTLFFLVIMWFPRVPKSNQISLILVVNMNIMHLYILSLNSFGLLICCEIFGFLFLTHLSFYVITRVTSS